MTAGTRALGTRGWRGVRLDTVGHSTRVWAPTGDMGDSQKAFLLNALTYIPIGPDPSFSLQDVAVYGPTSPAQLYEKITVKRGATLKIKASSKPYYFGEVVLEPGAQVLVDTSQGPQRLYIRDRIISRGQWVDTHTIVRGDILIGYYGTSAVSIEFPITATIVAPRTSISLDASGQVFQGSFMGSSVTVHQSSTVYHLPTMASWATAPKRALARRR